MREHMMEKRARKLALAAQEVPIGEKLKVYGDRQTAFTIVSWGSNNCCESRLDAPVTMRGRSS